MDSWLIRLRDIVWTSVLAVLFTVLSLIYVFIDTSIAVVFAVNAATFALLANRVS